ncbi:MAG: type II toxin-antitoxin system PemK/MazF family toxin [Gammaproteobacteria bacterium]|nr:type II toxin-antitoxin system PemK/MazF family toxin [Gammaproteobacteria bacterium]
MRRAEIYYINLDPANSSINLKKTRVLIVSNNANNKAANTITVLPIIASILKVHPFEVLIEASDSGLNRAAKAQCHQIRTISKSRLIGQKLGQLDTALMHKIDNAIRLHLSL